MKLGLTWREKLGKPECPYLERWVLNFGKLGSLRLHHWWRSDDARNKHDHPADFITLVLKGGYTDISDTGIPCRNLPHDNRHPHEYATVNGKCSRCNDTGSEVAYTSMVPGRVGYRKAEHRHTVSVHAGGCWTLLYFFPDRRDWGFWVPRKVDGKLKFKKANKYFLEHGHHPCDQP